MNIPQFKIKNYIKFFTIFFIFNGCNKNNINGSSNMRKKNYYSFNEIENNINTFTGTIKGQYKNNRPPFYPWGVQLLYKGIKKIDNFFTFKDYKYAIEIDKKNIRELLSLIENRNINSDLPNYIYSFFEYPDKVSKSYYLMERLGSKIYKNNLELYLLFLISLYPVYLYNIQVQKKIYNEYYYDLKSTIIRDFKIVLNELKPCLFKEQNINTNLIKPNQFFSISYGELYVSKNLIQQSQAKFEMMNITIVGWDNNDNIFSTSVISPVYKKFTAFPKNKILKGIVIENMKKVVSDFSDFLESYIAIHKLSNYNPIYKDIILELSNYKPTSKDTIFEKYFYNRFRSNQEYLDYFKQINKIDMTRPLYIRDLYICKDQEHLDILLEKIFMSFIKTHPKIVHLSNELKKGKIKYLKTNVSTIKYFCEHMGIVSLIILILIFDKRPKLKIIKNFIIFTAISISFFSLIYIISNLNIL